MSMSSRVARSLGGRACCSSMEATPSHYELVHACRDHVCHELPRAIYGKRPRPFSGCNHTSLPGLPPAFFSSAHFASTSIHAPPNTTPPQRNEPEVKVEARKGGTRNDTGTGAVRTCYASTGASSSPLPGRTSCRAGGPYVPHRRERNVARTCPPCARPRLQPAPVPAAF